MPAPRSLGQVLSSQSKGSALAISFFFLALYIFCSLLHYSHSHVSLLTTTHVSMPALYMPTYIWSSLEKHSSNELPVLAISLPQLLYILLPKLTRALIFSNLMIIFQPSSYLISATFYSTCHFVLCGKHLY